MASAAAVEAAPASAPAPMSAAKTKAAKQAARMAALHARSLALLQPDSPWTVETSKAGRRAVATQLIHAGTTIVHEHAAGWVLRSQLADQRCAHCTKPANHDTQMRTCTGCGVYHYCSEQCESDAEALHTFVCPLMDQLEDAATESSCDADMLLLVATLVAGYFIEQRAAAAAATATASVGDCVAAAAASSSDGLTHAKWLHVQDLMSNRDTAQADWLDAIELGCRQLHRMYAKFDVFQGLQLPSVDTLVSLCCRINSNSHSLFDNYSSSNVVVGLGLFPTTSILNHSCYPNCFFSGLGGRMVVRSLRDIDVGEELCVPYVDLYQPRRDRMIELHADKHFICSCERCWAEEKVKIGVAALSSPSSSSSSAADAVAPSPSSPSIGPEQVHTWTCMGAVLCPVCKAKVDEAELDQLADGGDGKKDGKKKKNKAAAAPPAAMEEKNDVPAEQKSARRSASSPAASFSAVSFVSDLSARGQGLLVWRGGGEEVKAASRGSTISSKSWVCSRAACATRLPIDDVDQLLHPLLVLFQRARSLQQQQERASDALATFEQLLTDAERLVPRDNLLCMLALTPMLNLAMQLQRVDATECVLQRIISAMERAFPRALPEVSDFLVVMAETQLQAAEQPGADVDRRVHAARQLYQRAYDIRWIACGPQHPRTNSLEAPEKWRERVAHTPRSAGSSAPLLPTNWTDTLLPPAAS